MVQTRRSFANQMKKEIGKRIEINSKEKRKYMIKKLKKAQKAMNDSFKKLKKRQQKKKTKQKKTKRIKKKTKVKRSKNKVLKKSKLSCLDLINDISNKYEQETVESQVKNKKTRTKKAVTSKNKRVFSAKKKKKTIKKKRKAKNGMSERKKNIKKVIEDDILEIKKNYKEKRKENEKNIRKRESIVAKNILGLLDLIPINPPRVVEKPDKSGGYMGAGEEIVEESEEECVEYQNPNILGFHDLLKSFTQPVKTIDNEEEANQLEAERQMEEIQEIKQIEDELNIEEVENMEIEGQSEEFEDQIDFLNENDLMPLKSSSKFNSPSKKVNFEEIGENAVVEKDKENYDVDVNTNAIRKRSVSLVTDNFPINNEYLSHINTKKEAAREGEKKCAQKEIIVEEASNQIVEELNEDDKENGNHIPIQNEEIEQIIQNEVVLEDDKIEEETEEKVEETREIQIEEESDGNMIIEEESNDKEESDKNEEQIRKGESVPIKIEVEEPIISKKIEQKKLKKEHKPFKFFSSKPQKRDNKNSSKTNVAFQSAKIRELIFKSKPKSKKSLQRETFNLMSKESFKSSTRVSMKEKYQDLYSPRNLIPLSSSLNRLLSKFKFLTKYVNMLCSNRRTPFFNTLQNTIKSNHRVVVTKSDLQHMLQVLKYCFNLSWSFNSKIDDYDLILSFSNQIEKTNSRALNKHMMHEARQQYNNPNQNTCPNSKTIYRSMNQADIADQISKFRKKLLNLVGVFHNKYLDENGVQGSSFQGEFLQSWHSSFVLEDVTDAKIPLAALPSKPKKVSMEEIRKQKLQKVLGESARVKKDQINQELQSIHRKYREMLDNQKNNLIFSQFEKEKFNLCSTNDEGSISRQFSTELEKKNKGGTVSSASASQNYISKTLKWKQKLKLAELSPTQSKPNFVENADMDLGSKAKSQLKKLESNMDNLVSFGLFPNQR
jgi:hypothetical protein